MIEVGDILLLSYSGGKTTDICMVTYEPNRFIKDCKYSLRCLACGDGIGYLKYEDLQNVKNVLKCDDVKIVKNKDFINYMNKKYNPLYEIKRHISLIEKIDKENSNG